MEGKRKFKGGIILVSILILIILVLGIYFILIKKDDNEAGGQGQKSNNASEVVFKSRKSGYTFKIVDNIDEKIKEDIRKTYCASDDCDDMGSELYDFANIQKVGYINDVAYIIDEKYTHEDENYVRYWLSGVDQSDIIILINKKEKVIENDTLFDEYGYDFIKTSAGYFFVILTDEAGDIIYTTTWQKLGYAGENLQYDADGVYVYLGYDENNFEFVGDLVKFDVNGNEIA